MPDYAPEGFREAVNNAVLHRDYTRLGAVYVQWQPDHMLITDPGGFPDGVTINNILVHEPKPRNPRLAEAFKRIGLIEQTGRGVDKIYMGQLRYGRPPPDYTRSDAGGVRVILRSGRPSLQFAALVYDLDKQGRPLTLDELIALNMLLFEPRVEAESLGKQIQKGTVEGHRVLERLHKRGLVEAQDEKGSRAYHLAASLYRRLEGALAYVRPRAADRTRQQQMIRNVFQADPEGRITREQVAKLCRITPAQAYHLLHRMCVDGELELHGKGRGAYYALKRTIKTNGIEN